MIVNVTCSGRDLHFQNFVILMSDLTRPFNPNGPNFDDIGDDVAQEFDNPIYETNIYTTYMDEESDDENLRDFDDIPGHSISGRGVLGSDVCGKRKYVYSALGGKPRHTHMSCKTQGCPKCFRLWAKRLSKNSARFLLGVSIKEKSEIFHWTYSPKFGTFRDWESLERDFFDFISEFGYTRKNAIVAITRHPRKLKCASCPFGDPKSANCNGCKEGEAQKKIWHFLPHLHVICNVFIQPSDMHRFTLLEAEKNVIFKNITFANRDWLSRPVKDKKGEMLTPYDRLKKILAYEFGHALYDPDKSMQVIRYFGRCAKTEYRLRDLPPVHIPVQDTSFDPPRPICRIDNHWIDDNGSTYNVWKNWSWEVKDHHKYDEKFPYGTKKFELAIPLVETDYPITDPNNVVETLVTYINGARLRIVPPLNLQPLPVNSPTVEILVDVPIAKDSDKTIKKRRLVKNNEFVSMKQRMGYLELSSNRIYRDELDYYDRKRKYSFICPVETWL